MCGKIENKKSKKILDSIITGMPDDDCLKHAIITVVEQYGAEIVNFTIKNMFSGKLQGLTAEEIVEKFNKNK